MRSLEYDEPYNDRDGISPSIVMLHGRPAGSSGADKGSGSDSGAEQIDGQMKEFIPYESTRSIINQTLVILSKIKEGILQIVIRG